MGKQNKVARGSSRDPLSYAKDKFAPIAQLVATKQYHQIMEAIEHTQNRVDDPMTKALFDIVRQLCVVCQQSETAVVQQRDRLAQIVADEETHQEQLAGLLSQLPILTLSASLPKRQNALPRKVVQPLDRQESLPLSTTAPALVAYMLGEFRLFQDERPVQNWPNGKGKAIFKYLLLHRQQPIPKEVLMAAFWPEATADAARNNLNVTIYNLRKALRQDAHHDFSHIIFRDNAYQLNPEMTIWVDAEAFAAQVQEAMRLEQQGDWETAVSVYEAAAALYQGAFLAEDRYETWVDEHRHHLQMQYLHVLDTLCHYYFENHLYSQCIATCQKILAIDNCCEEAHRWLMNSYYQQGQRNLVLRQYHRCQAALANDLDVEPMPETTDLYQQIRGSN